MSAYPVRIEGELAPQLSRWLWLVKWLLLVPHLVCLAFLWIGFVLATLVAFVVLLFGGSYPRRLFDYNVGVLRWSWRASYYGYSALATDVYPPFTLGEAPDYPTRLEIDYPERFRHGLPLLGWWLVGIPQYAIASLLAGGSRIGIGGIVGILVCVAGILVLVKRTYPESLFDLVLGFNRWCLRVLAFAAFLTPEYPPFRLDEGRTEPRPVLA